MNAARKLAADSLWERICETAPSGSTNGAALRFDVKVSTCCASEAHDAPSDPPGDPRPCSRASSAVNLAVADPIEE